MPLVAIRVQYNSSAHTNHFTDAVIINLFGPLPCLEKGHRYVMYSVLQNQQTDGSLVPEPVTQNYYSQSLANHR
jgi:DNA-binding MltR family transcriptional regulator